MKGHLGFRCRICQPPGAVSNLSQVGDVVVGSNYGVTITWGAPSDIGSGPVIGYRVEEFHSSSNSWQLLHANTVSTTASLSWCREPEPALRVSAINRCGVGTPSQISNFTYGNFSASTVQGFSGGPGYWQPPCWASTITAYCIGWGGEYSLGGASGALAWKTWTNYGSSAWPQASYLVTQTGDNPRSEFTLNGQTVTARAAMGGDPGTPSGGDGGYPGRSGGTDNASFAATGTPYSGTYYYGGGIGGCDPGGPGGTLICPSPVSPCQRRPARDRNNLLSVAALAGYRVTEDCAIEAAFGSGGVRIPYSSYGVDNVYFAPGYGGGGFGQDCQAGPGIILVKMS